MFRTIVSTVLVFIALAPSLQAQDDKVFRALSPEATEKLLQGLGVKFEKSANKKGDEHYFDFIRNSYKIRLTHFSPQELMLDCVFRAVPIDKVNQWNTLTKLSRANWQKDSTGEITILEYAIDLTGGATEGTIKQFLVRFDDELKKYEKFINGNNNGDEAILATVADEKIENILKTMGINYKKKENSSGVMIFDFVMNEHKLRMYNFGGKDLMIDAHFRKISLEDANRYNLSRKFVRVVNYKSKDVEYSALEVNLDCEGGISEGMIRHWIASYGEDVRHFADYAKKLQPDKK